MARSDHETHLAQYLDTLRKKRGLGGGTRETSYYGALEELLGGLGRALDPKVLCLSQLRDTGAGHPDFGLYTARQVQRGEPRPGQLPQRGVVEVKPVADDAWLTAEGAQVSKYWQRYRLVLVTNYRDFLLLGEDAAGRPAKLESFRLANDANSFWALAA